MKWPVLLCSLAFACSSNGPGRIAIPLELAGETGSSSIATSSGPIVTLDEAKLAFGPLYFCASPSGAEQCEVARLEWLGTAVVDLLDATASPVGVLSGSTGRVASYLCDLSISSQLTREEPYVLDAAADLDGSSLRLRGTVEFQGRALPFSVDLAVMQTDSTVQGVPVIQSPKDPGFEQEIEANLTGLSMRFSVAAWLGPVDFTPYFMEEDCAQNQESSLCHGNSKVTCTEQGEIAAIEDCEEKSQICLPGVGCQDELALTDDDAALRTLKATLLSDFNPEFTWRTE